MTRLRLALAITSGYLIAFYLGASIAFLLPFGSDVYALVSRGAQVLAWAFGMDY